MVKCNTLAFTHYFTYTNFFLYLGCKHFVLKNYAFYFLNFPMSSHRRVLDTFLHRVTAQFPGLNNLVPKP